MGVVSSKARARVAQVAIIAMAGLSGVAGSACGSSSSSSANGGATPDNLGDPPSQPVTDVPPARVDDVLTPVTVDDDLPALGALVLRGSVVIAEGVSGVRKVGDPTLATTNDAWSLGSDAQAMTATVAAALVEEGKLTWSSTLGVVLADVPMHASYKDVPLDALLGHRGGAPATLPVAVDQSMRGAGTPQQLRDAAVRAILVEPTAVPPLTQYLASDAGYLMVAAMLERVTGESWEDLMRTRLIEPLGMLGCAYGGAVSSANDAEPWGHVAIDGVVTPVAPGSAGEPAPALGPAGVMRCPLRDWGKFCALHLAGARKEHTVILGDASFVKLQTPGIDTNALGWSSVSRPWAGSMPALNQASQAGVAHALAWVVPEKNLTLLVVTNRGDDRAIHSSEDAMAQLIGRFVPKDP
jgi:CubicO group peptidase (beta-lactamase class C family)